MDSQELQLPQRYQLIINRFMAACRADERVVAAFLGGSYAKGTNDEYSDLDLYLITTDEAYEGFRASREAFVRLLGEPLFLEDFNDFGFDMMLFIFSDGIEGELALGRESHFKHIHGGPYKILLDKQGILEGATFPGYQVAEVEQVETLCRLIYWFWHDLSQHFITAIGRGHLWSAHGHLDELRLTCINLARLQQDFSIPADGYDNLEQAVPAELLAPLQPTFCPLEREAILQAALTIVRFYQQIAPPLAQKHGIIYPTELARLMADRLERLYNP